MKKLLLLIVLTSSVKISSQELTSAKQEIVSSSIIYDKVDGQAEYPGGIDAFRRNFAQTFNGGNINARGKIKSEAIFVIGQDGYITDIDIKGDNKSMNKEMKRAINAMSKTKWAPATIEGQPVKFRFRLPITMNF